MKLHLELFRYGEEAEIPFQKRGRLALLIVQDDVRHVDIMADSEEKFDGDTVMAALDALKRRAEIIAHLIGEGTTG